MQTRRSWPALSEHEMSAPHPLTFDQICHAAFGRLPDAIAKPGGDSRKTVIIRIGARPFAVSNRGSEGRAGLEALILRNLVGTGLVPRLVFAKGTYVVQEYIAGKRLSVVLDEATPNEARTLLAQAARGLAVLQEAAVRKGIVGQVPKIGDHQGWLEDLMDMPSHLAKRFHLEVPALDRKAILRHIQVDRFQFVKWDARPGNAIVTEQGKIVWIDWEHCGRRQAPDDLVWLLADEWAPDIADIETELLSLFLGPHSVQEASAEVGFTIMATLHSFIRLDLILSRKGDGPWWDHDTCRAADHIGVTKMHAQRVLSKAARWASSNQTMSVLTPLLQQLSERVDEL